MVLNEVANMRELQLHGVINVLTKDIQMSHEEKSVLKLKVDSIVERAETAERELLDREESIYCLTLKLISCEARLLELQRSKDLAL